MDGSDNARIGGAYLTEQGRDLSHRSGFSLALEAMNGALDDAGITLDDPTICRKIANPRLALTTSPGTPTLQGSMMVLGPE